MVYVEIDAICFIEGGLMLQGNLRAVLDSSQDSQVCDAIFMKVLLMVFSGIGLREPRGTMWT